jgi:microcystin-dependent protein
MPNTIRLKRSATAGKVPLVADLQLGELAVNTNDGRLYLKRDSGTAAVIEVGPVRSIAGRTGDVTLSVADIAGSVSSVAGRTGAVALAIADVAGLPASLTPVGAVIPYAGLSAPPRWLFCFGQNVSRTTYAALFAAIATTYGAGDGATTFTLPDLRGRAIAGKDDMGGSSANRLTAQSGGLNGDTLGAAGGAETHTLSQAQLPPHVHLVDMGAPISTGWDGGHSHTFGYGQRNKSGDGSGVSDLTHTGSIETTGLGGAHAHTVDIPPFNSGSAGSGAAHNNVQPTFVLNYMIYAGA